PIGFGCMPETILAKLAFTMPLAASPAGDQRESGGIPLTRRARTRVLTRPAYALARAGRARRRGSAEDLPCVEPELAAELRRDERPLAGLLRLRERDVLAAARAWRRQRQGVQIVLDRCVDAVG